MKRFALVLASFMLFCFAGVVVAQSLPKTFLSVGFLNRSIGESFPGFNVQIGGYVSKESTLALEFSWNQWNYRKIGIFSYGNSMHTYDDGEVYYKYTALNFLLSWSYVVDLSKKFQFRVGPSAGVMVVTGADDWSPTEKDGSKITDIPDSTKITKTTVTGGASLGLIWNISEYVFLDAGYRLMLNPGIKFDRTSVKIGSDTVIIPAREFSTAEHQFNISAGLRF